MVAITAYEWLKAFHVLTAVLWVGGGVAIGILGAMTIRMKDPVRLAQFAQQVARLGGVYFPPLSLALLGLGFGLVEKGELGYSLVWVQIAIAGWAASFLIGAGFLGPRSSKLSKLLKERPPEDPEAQALIRQLLIVSRLDSVILLFIVFDMTAKPWS